MSGRPDPSQLVEPKVVLWADGAGPLPSDLTEAMRSRGLTLERAHDCYDALAKLVRAHAASRAVPVALVLVEPGSLRQVEQVVHQAGLHAPRAIVWAYESSAHVKLRPWIAIEAEIRDEPKAEPRTEFKTEPRIEPEAERGAMPPVVTRPRPQRSFGVPSLRLAGEGPENDHAGGAREPDSAGPIADGQAEQDSEQNTEPDPGVLTDDELAVLLGEDPDREGSHG